MSTGLWIRGFTIPSLAVLFCQCTAPRHAVTMRDQPTDITYRDGKVMPYQIWHGNRPHPRAVLICLHGLSGAGQDFWPVGETFPKAGYAVYAMQLRGQGNDPIMAERGDLRSARKWSHDLLDFVAMVRSRHAGVPVFVMGESLGALISIDTIARDPNPLVDGLILLSPVVKLRESLHLSLARLILTRSLMMLAPQKRVSLETLGQGEIQVTSGTTHRQQMAKTAHYVPTHTLRLFSAVEKLIHRSMKSAEKLHLPLLVLYSPHDALTSHPDVETFFDRVAAPNKTKAFFPLSYHLILHDKERKMALDCLQKWLDNQTRPPRKQ